ncbi:DUF2285 domain-containing protein [Roseospira marina]|uniref:DUF2285 domain-containing protein n=1 Tax=Roseospira marina TaxID=140057 RepID=A0A5M6I7B3_9PROT|nr:DUF2285 domain-containing protein [Roseospira marina]KAA5603992.1 DUF2285 domain-containing protein [Roseospira marina]MBB4315910.1 hypothetical protein [Roseospira marina]
MSCFADETMDLVFWSSEMVPSVLTVEARAGDATAAEPFDLGRLPLPVMLLRQPNSARQLLIQDGARSLQIEVVADGAARHPVRHPVRLLVPLWPAPEDEPRLLALRRFLHIRSAQMLPDRLYTPERRAGRWLNMLRAFDARRAGASQRQIAAAIFGADRAAQDWAGQSDYLRLRVQRLVRGADHMAARGYRDLLR